MNKKLILSLALTFLLTSLSTAATLTVPGTYANIQAAINAAAAGDEVVVDNGTYSGTGNRNLDFGGKAITVRSAYGPANCTINCGGTGNRAFYFHNSETPASVVQGFTITGGNTYYGGAIECEEASPSIDNCIIKNNTATYGGAIDCFIASPVITNCIITNNIATYDGGAIECESESMPEITNCLFANNTAGGSGTIDCYDLSSPVIINCTIANNTGSLNYGGIYTISSTATIRNSILWNNGDEIFGSGATATYSCIQDGDVGTGNIKTDPMFRAGPSVNSGNYYLSQTAAGQLANSPCVNGGYDSAEAIFGLGSQYTTRTDNIPDTGSTPRTVDMGFHYPNSGATVQYKLITQVDPSITAGTVTPNYPTPGQSYLQYSEVSLQATPTTGYKFMQWKDALTATPGTFTVTPGPNEVYVVTLNADRTVTAKFSSQATYRLTTDVIGGNGSILNVVPNDFPDPLDPNAYFIPQHTTATITTKPNAGYLVKQWLIGNTETFDINTPGTYSVIPGSGNSYTTTIDANTTIAVEFKYQEYTLSTSVVSGNGSISPKRSTYPVGTTVSLTATPKSTSYRVKEWGGDAINKPAWNVTTNSVVMNADKNVTVEFEPSTSKLVVVRSGDVNGIQNAIDLSSSGDIVQIPHGTYTATGFIVQNKSITILGDPEFPESVIIDGTGIDVSFREPLGFKFTGSGNSVLNGVTIANISLHHGRATNNKSPDQSKPSYSPDTGQAIYIDGGNHQILNCIIRNVVVRGGAGADGYDGNTAIHQGGYGGDGASIVGGGIVVFGGSPVFKNCLIEDCCAVGGLGGNGANGFSYTSDTEPNNGDAGQGGLGGFAFGGGISVVDINALPSYTFTFYIGGTKISIPYPPRWWYGVASTTLPRPTFENCTIRNCFAKGGHGGNGGDAGFNFGDPCGYGGLTTVVKAGQGNIINDNSARGGGVFIGQNCNAKFINCTITDNATEGSISGVGGYSYWETQQQPKKNYHLPSFGAGVFCDKKSTVKFSKCNLQNNKTISTNAGETIPSDDSDFSGGAGVGLWFVSSAEVNDCNFTLNSAPIGGGIYGFWTDVNVVDCNISYNNSFSGGGIYALNSSVEIRKSLVKGNNAGTQSDSNQNQYAGYPLFGSGGGVYALASMIDINDTTITENSATATGGGVCIDGWPTPETHKPLIKNCLITNNTAVTSGGGIASIILADLQIQNCTIANNIVSGATGSGGGLYGSFESDTIVKDSIIWGNTSVNGSQIALSNGQSDMPASLNITYSDIQTSGQDANIVLDVVICVDTTGSMYNVIESIKNAASNIVDKIAESTSAYRIAVVDFRNYEVYVPGLNYAYKDEIAFSSDKAVILQAINNLTAVLGTGSLNGRTSGYAALTHCIDGASLGDWRTAKNTKKIIIYMSDAAPDDPDPFFGYNLQTVTGAANSKNVNIYTILTGYGVVDTIAKPYFNNLATATGGIFIETPDGSTASDAVIQAINVATQPPTYIYLDDPLCSIVGLLQDANGVWKTTDTSNIAKDPNFIFGYYLSHIATGQPKDSACIDAGSALAATVGMDTYTTRMDAVPDSGIVDMGFHYDSGSPVSQYDITITILPNSTGINGTITAYPNNLISYNPATATYTYRFFEGTTPTFTAIPNANYFIKGWYDKTDMKLSSSSTFSFTVNADNTYFVRFKKEQIVPVSGGGLTLRNAVNNAENGDKLIVAAGTYNGDINIGGKQIKLYGVNPDDSNVVARTIIDCNGSLRGVTFAGGESSNTVLDGFTIINGNGNGGSIQGGAIFIAANSSPLIVNVDVNNCRVLNADGGAIYIGALSNPEFRNLAIKNCRAQNGNGGGVYISNSSNPKFTDCLFTNCFATLKGGAIYSSLGNLLQFTDCIFNLNTAGASAGAIYAGELCTVNLQGCQFGGNSANVNGGAVMYAANCVFDINSCDFSSNDSNDIAGAIYISEKCKGKIYDTNMTDNTAHTDGGAIYITNSDIIEIGDSSIIANTAVRGGGIYAFASPKVSITECIINSNKASGADDAISEGGGIYGYAGPALIENCQLNYNTATTSGGSIYLTGPDDINATVIKNCLMTKNGAGRDGGGASVNWFANASFENCTIAYNALTRKGYGATYGGGLYCSYESNIDVNNCIIWGSAAENGAQLAIGSGDESYPLPSTANVTYSDVGPPYTPVDSNSEPNKPQEPLAPSLVVTHSNDANALANKILGQGISIVGTPTFIGTTKSAGTFVGGTAAGIGIESGIILTNGDANTAMPPNNNDGSSANNNLPGDKDLDALVPQSNTHDATVLTFQFTTAGGDLYFNYVFASEEYNEFTNSSYNDVFAFFLDGVNIALIPGTTTPVSINNVNGGNPLGTKASNPSLYNNNDISDGGPFYNIGYDGFTNVFTAKAFGVGAGTHTIKLAIADTGDSALDSAVFIQGGTFSDTQTSVNLHVGPPIYVEQGCTLNWDPNSGWNAPITNTDQNPLFKEGYYLSQKKAGQDTNSPCVDTGSALASILGFDTLTTRIDGVNDISIIDMGYHYPYGLPPVPQYDITVTILSDANDPGIHGHITADPNNLISYTPATATYIYRFYKDTMPTLTAVPDSNCFVKGWYNKTNAKISASESLKFTVDSNNTYFVRFKTKRVIPVSGGGSALINAVNNAGNGDTLVVAAETYNGGINISGKQIKIYGINPGDSNITQKVVIDCSGGTSGFIFGSDLGSDTVINGFTIINGNSNSSPGSAIFIDSNSSPTIANIEIRDFNVVNVNGGGIYVGPASSSNFINVHISNCRTTNANGGAIFISSMAKPVFTDCSVTNCSVHNGSGGAVYCNGTSMPTFNTCTFTGNSADISAGAIFFQAGSESRFEGCNFANNTMLIRNGSRGNGGGIFYALNNTFEVNDCNFSGNGANSGAAVFASANCSGFFNSTKFSKNAADKDGGAIYITDSNAINIEDCNVTDNNAIRGGGIFVVNSPKVAIADSQINSNGYNPGSSSGLIGQGGGIYSFNGPALIDSCRINNNAALTSGGGIYVSGEFDPNMHNCLITNNKAKRDGGGVSANWNAYLTLSNCTIVDNNATDGNSATSYGGGLSCAYDAYAKVINSILWNNNAKYGQEISIGSKFDAVDKRPAEVYVAYSDVQNGAPNVFSDTEHGCRLIWAPPGNLGDPNIGTNAPNPLFVTGYWGNYYLSQTASGDPGQTTNSPCVNAGLGTAISNGMYKHTTRTDHVIDIADSNVDMGYHYTLIADPLGDFNFDGHANFTDFGLFMLYWLDGNCTFPYWCSDRDLNHDGVVDFIDYAIFAENFGNVEKTPPMPNPMTWANVPSPSGPTTITMKATKAFDLSSGSRVEYLFDCNSPAPDHDSGWITSSTYTNTGLVTGHQYSYKVKARDEHHNETGWSVIRSAIPSIVDITPPIVSIFSPLDNATGVNVDANLVIHFSENVLAGTGNIVIKKTLDNSIFETIPVGDAKVTITGTTVTINPAATFDANTGYYVQIAATCFKDSSDNYYVGINNTTTWNFTTAGGSGGPPDNTAPSPVQWAILPSVYTDGLGNYYHTMSAVAATDAHPPVSYRFVCISGLAPTRDWVIDGTSYTSPAFNGTENYAVYQFQVKDALGNTATSTAFNIYGVQQ